MRVGIFPGPTSAESGRYIPVYGGCILVHAGSGGSSYAGLAAGEQLGTFGAGLGVACWLLRVIKDHANATSDLSGSPHRHGA